MTESEAIEMLNTFPKEDEMYDTAQMAIKALEKQIPKKPIINYIIISEDATEVEYTCSVCGTNFVELTPCKEWCPYCGNKIDWSDEE